MEYQALDDRFNKLRAQLGAIGGLVRTQFSNLRSSGVKLDQEAGISQLLNAEGVEVATINGITQVIEYREKVVEVPVQDSRTKQLINLLAVQMNKYFAKYPKLR